MTASIIELRGLVIGKLFGHTEPQTSARYAHPADATMHEVADSMSSAIGGLFKK